MTQGSGGGNETPPEPQQGSTPMTDAEIPVPDDVRELAEELVTEFFPNSGGEQRWGLIEGFSRGLLADRSRRPSSDEALAKKARLHANWLETNAGRNADLRAIADDLRIFANALASAPSDEAGKLREALKPFAKFAQRIPDKAPDGTPITVMVRGEHIMGPATVRDMRRARNALTTGEPE